MQSKEKPERNSGTLSDSEQTIETIPPRMVTADTVQSGKVPAVRTGMQQGVRELQPKFSTYSAATTSTVLQPEIGRAHV